MEKIIQIDIVLVYKITDTYPKSELFCLTSQLRRVAISISSNIVEGFGRQTMKEKVQFYYMAQGSNIELQNQIYISYGVKYLDEEKLDEIIKLSTEINKMLSSLIKSSKSKIT